MSLPLPGEPSFLRELVTPSLKGPIPDSPNERGRKRPRLEETSLLQTGLAQPAFIRDTSTSSATEALSRLCTTTPTGKSQTDGSVESSVRPPALHLESSFDWQSQYETERKAHMECIAQLKQEREQLAQVRQELATLTFSRQMERKGTLAIIGSLQVRCQYAQSIVASSTSTIQNLRNQLQVSQRERDSLRTALSMERQRTQNLEQQSSSMKF